ncbi:CAP domain-containing protein [Georgenia satyanarayanai]|uniref:CAP domain-containing protein n=1 Tax=Georgenia satyanarayanai TaxID=860221 RepID=UPI00186B2C3E|nr:CAP domain-containing protein [Georgenia satyanarayanai]
MEAELSQAVYERLGAVRAENYSPRLDRLAELDAVARGWSLSHAADDGIGTSPVAPPPWPEELCWGSWWIFSASGSSIDEAFQSWLDDPFDRRRLLDLGYKQVGVGVVSTDSGRVYVNLAFGYCQETSDEPVAPIFEDNEGSENDFITIPDVRGVRYRTPGDRWSAGRYPAEYFFLPGGRVVIQAVGSDDSFTLPGGEPFVEWELDFETDLATPADPVFRFDGNIEIPEAPGVRYFLNDVAVSAGIHEIEGCEGLAMITVEATEGYTLRRRRPSVPPTWYWGRWLTKESCYPPDVPAPLPDPAPTPGPSPTPTPAPPSAGHAIPHDDGSSTATIDDGGTGGTGRTYHLSDGNPSVPARVLQYGNDGGRVYVGDWDGDGTDTLAYRIGATFYVTNTNVSGGAHRALTYGKPGDRVLVGDWDGDGRDTFAVRRGKVYHVRNSLGGGAADLVVAYGRAADDVLVGDWDGDRRDTLAVRRGRVYHVKNSISGGAADTVLAYGRASDDVYVGDWDGDRRDTFAVRRGNTYYVTNTTRGGAADRVLTYGRTTDTALVGDWNGDSRDSLGIRRTVP